jgi:hypothetical protein
MLMNKLKILASVVTMMCILTLGGGALLQSWADDKGDAPSVFFTDDDQPREQGKREQPTDGAVLKGKIGAIDTANRTITLVQSMFDRKAGQANETEKVLNVPKDAVIVQDGVSIKLENLKRGFHTTVKADQKNALSITVEGGQVRGVYKSMNPERNTITVVAGRDMGEKTYHLLKTTKVALAGGKSGKVQEISVGAEIVLTLSVEGDNTVIRIQPVMEEKKKRGQ